jgi:hypothetical protein
MPPIRRPEGPAFDFGKRLDNVAFVEVPMSLYTSSGCFYVRIFVKSATIPSPRAGKPRIKLELSPPRSARL